LEAALNRSLTFAFLFVAFVTFNPNQLFAGTVADGGACKADADCVSGSCVSDLCVAKCTPACTGKLCGNDGCGGTCGTCPNASDTCDSAGQCTAATPAPKPAGSLADGESCTAHTDCKSKLCDAATSTCSGKKPVAKPAAPSCTPDCSSKTCGDDGCGHSCGSCKTGETCDAANQCIALTECEDDSKCGDGEVCWKKFCQPDPCFSLPFSENDNYGCFVAAAVDLQMPGTVSSVRWKLLQMSSKNLEAYKKRLEGLVRNLVCDTFDYQVGADVGALSYSVRLNKCSTVLNEKDPAYKDNAGIRALLKGTATLLDVLGVGRFNLPHRPAPKATPADRG